MANKADIGDRSVYWMPTPTMVKGSVEAGSGRQVCCLGNSGAIVVNKNIEKDAGLVRAIKDFLMFLYTQSELDNYARNTGLKMNALNYDLNESVYQDLPAGQKNALIELDKAAWVYRTDKSDIWKTHYSEVKINYGAPIHRSSYINTTYYSIFKAMKNGSNTKQAFESSWISEKTWEGYCGNE